MCAARPGHLPPPERMPTSISSRAKSTMWLDVSSRTAIEGWAIWNEPRWRASQLEPNVWTVLMTSVPCAPVRTAA